MSQRSGWMILAVAMLLAVSPPSALADFERSFTVSGQRLALANLIGQISVSGKSGGDIEVLVNVRGEDASEDLISFDEGDGSLFVLFPIDEHDSYVYPEMGRGSRSQVRFRTERAQSGDRSFFEKFFESMGGEKVEVRGSGRGLEVWADIEVRVPAGKELLILNGVGAIEAETIDASRLVLDTQAGSIDARSIQGDLVCDTGSGHINVEGARGNVKIDTGSGHVDASDIEADELDIDTGSGHVTLHDAKAPNLHVDTGSGSVELTRVDASELEVDTGSGGVEAIDVGTDSAHIDTGSGSVRLELTRVGGGRYDVSTGSGGISLMLPEDASASVIAESGSGGVDVDVNGIREQRMRRDSAEFEMGEGTAQIELETGSGRIRIVGR